MMDSYDPKTYFTLSMHDNSKSVSVRFEGESLTVPQVLEEVLNFMKACGYCFEIDDYLDVVNDFKHEVKQERDWVDLKDTDFPDSELTQFDFPDVRDQIKANNSIKIDIVKPEDC